jgi:hypothetical protein
MKRFALGLFAIGLVLGVSVAGCKKTDNGGMQMGLPDGFVSTTCSTVDDCAPTACQTAKCNPVTHMCQYSDKTCDAESDCTMGMCDESSGGSCVQQPANDNMPCTTMDGSAGSCLSGTCTAVPSCYDTSGFGGSLAFCGPPDLSLTKDNNDPMMFGSAVVGSYPCAPTETGPEIAYLLDSDPTAGDEDITVSLRPVNADGTPASADDKDLDLIVLEDSCTATATCMNPTLSGGGYQGITAGTAKERVSFHATAGKSYYIVVDGKDMNQFRDYVVEVEACGRCQPADTTRLDCNVSTPLSGDTSKGAAQISDYKVGAAMTAVSAPGKEQAFYLRTADNAVRNATASIIAPSNDYRMILTATTGYGQCDVNNAIASQAGPAAQSITWKIDPGTDSFARYWVIVDTPTMTDTTFGLQLSCAPYCLAPYTLSCNGATDVTTVSGTTVPPKGVSQSSQYGSGAGSPCNGMTGLTGPEVAVEFAPNITGTKTYQLELQAKTTGKDLTMVLMDAGTGANPACDPTGSCLTLAANNPGGATGTLTTDITNNKTAAATFTAATDHVYFILIDGTDASGGDFKLNIAGTQTGAHCGM